LNYAWIPDFSGMTERIWIPASAGMAENILKESDHNCSF